MINYHILFNLKSTINKRMLGTKSLYGFYLYTYITIYNIIYNLLKHVDLCLGKTWQQF